MKTSSEHRSGRPRCLHVLCAAVLLFGVVLPDAPLWGQVPPSGETGTREAGETPAWFGSLQYIGLTWHFGGGTLPERYPLRLDDNATFVVHAGLAANVDRRLGDRWFLRGAIIGYADCALQPSVVLHLGIRGTVLRWGRHELNGGLGPTYVTRRSWHGRVEGYLGDERFRGGRDGGWESFGILYGTEVEHLYATAGGLQVQSSVVPWPEGITLKVGVRWPLGSE